MSLVQVWEVQFSSHPIPSKPLPHPSVCLSLSLLVSPPSSLSFPQALTLPHLCSEPSFSVQPTCPSLRVASADALVIVLFQRCPLRGLRLLIQKVPGSWLTSRGWEPEVGEAGPRPPRASTAGQQEVGSGAGKRPIHQACCPPPGLRAQLPEKGPNLRPGKGPTLSRFPVQPFLVLGQGDGTKEARLWVHTSGPPLTRACSQTPPAPAAPASPPPGATSAPLLCPQTPWPQLPPPPPLAPHQPQLPSPAPGPCFGPQFPPLFDDYNAENTHRQS